VLRIVVIEEQNGCPFAFGNIFAILFLFFEVVTHILRHRLSAIEANEDMLQ